MALKDHLSSIYDSFSRRQRPRGKGYPRDKITEKARNRILLLIRDVYSGKWNFDPINPQGNYAQDFWDQVHNILEHLLGRPHLSGDPSKRKPWDDGIAFAQTCEADEFFDFLEAIFKADCTWRAVPERNDLVDALNLILRTEQQPFQLTSVVTHQEPYGQHGGFTTYTVALPKVIRMDDEVAHTEAVLPALSILADPAYAGANDEFRNALDDYRKSEDEDCVAKCGSALESVLKVLCQKNGIPYDAKKDTAGPLLEKVLGKSALDTATFKEPLLALARLRNYAAHGGGSKVKRVDRHVSQYALTSTAAAIVLLVHDVGK